MATPNGYSRRQIALHWIVFVLVVLQFVLHEGISDAWDVVEDGGSVAFSPVVASHVIGGLIVLLLVIWRLQIRATRGTPPPPEEENPALKHVAKAVHAGLYLVLILMPLSGAVAWFGGVEPAAEAHEVMRLGILALVGLHIAGALYHQFILRNNLMNRMRQAAD